MKMLKSNQETLLTKIELNLPRFDETLKNSYKIKMEELIDGMYPLSSGDTKKEFATMEKWVGHDLLVDHILSYSKFRAQSNAVFDAAHIPKLQFKEYVSAVTAKEGLIPRIGATFQAYALPGQPPLVMRKQPEAEETEDKGIFFIDCFT
jgi:hypothetical protein